MGVFLFLFLDLPRALGTVALAHSLLWLPGTQHVLFLLLFNYALVSSSLYLRGFRLFLYADKSQIHTLVHLNLKPLIQSTPRHLYLNGRQVGLLSTHLPKLEACRPSGLPLLSRTPQQSSRKACSFYLLKPFQIHLSPSVRTATSLFTCVASHLRHNDSFLSGLPASYPLFKLQAEWPYKT